MFVMWYVWSRRGPCEPEFGELSRDRPGSRQNRDRIGPRPRDLAAAHVPGRGPPGGARSTATGPDPGDLDRCLGACQTWAFEPVVCRPPIIPLLSDLGESSRQSGLSPSRSWLRHLGSTTRSSWPRVHVPVPQPDLPSRSPGPTLPQLLSPWANTKVVRHPARLLARLRPPRSWMLPPRQGPIFAFRHDRPG